MNKVDLIEIYQIPFTSLYLVSAYKGDTLIEERDTIKEKAYKVALELCEKYQVSIGRISKPRDFKGE